MRSHRPPPRHVWGSPPVYKSVTQPTEAGATFLMYLYSVPLVALSGGATHCDRLLARGGRGPKVRAGEVRPGGGGAGAGAGGNLQA